MATRLDHLLMAVADLDVAAARLEAAHGLASVPGGSHGAVGTANRLVPLGEQYIELITVMDPTSEYEIAQRVAEWSAAGDTLVGVSLAVDDIAAVAARIGSAVVPMTRGDGDAAVTFSVTGMEGALGPDRLPFFIEWGRGAEHRLGEAVPAHRTNVSRLAWVELSGDETRIAEWLGGEDVDGLRIVPGSRGIRAGIATAAGEIVLVGNT